MTTTKDPLKKRHARSAVAVTSKKKERHRALTKETIASQRIARMDIPSPVLHLDESKLVRDLLRTEGIGQVLLVGKHEQQAVFHLAVRENAVELLLRFVDAVRVGGVNDKDQALGASVVVSPERPDLVLAADILPKRVVASAIWIIKKETRDNGAPRH